MELPKIRNKKAALEMSIGTVVVLVLGMTMLILGLVLVKNIFGGATDNIDVLNEGVKDRINKLFSEDSSIRSVILLSGGKAEIKQGEEWGIAASIKNIETGTSQASQFSYNTIVSNSYSESDCRGLTAQEALSWIVTRDSGTFNIPPGESEEFIIRFQIPETAPLCIIPFDIIINKGNEPYDTNFFDVVIKS